MELLVDKMRSARHAYKVLLRKLSWYAVVGATASLTYMATSVLCTWALPNLSQAATALGMTASAIVSYLGHHYLTFKADGDHAAYLRRFIIQVAFSYGFNAFITWLIVKVFDLPVSFVITTVVILLPIVNFFIYQWFVFKPRKSGSSVSA